MGTPQTAQSIPLGLPYQGMDLQTPLVDLPMSKAAAIDNFFLDGQTIRVREGTRITSTYTGAGVAVLSGLGSYTSTAGVSTLYATASDGATQRVVNVSSASGSNVAINAPTASLWVQYRNYLYIFDWITATTPLAFDGATWGAIGFTGLTTSALVCGNAYRNRLYLVERDTARVWYAGVDSISGALTSIDFASVLEFGGGILNVFAVSFGGNSPANQYLAVVSTQGEILYYQGSYPGSPTFEIVTRAKVSKPWGRQCFASFEGDVYLATDGGLVSLRTVMAAASGNQKYTAISEPIAPYWKSFSRAMREALGASTFQYLGYSRVCFNSANSCIYVSTYYSFPRTNNKFDFGDFQSKSRILVYNTLTGAWFTYNYENVRVYGLCQFGDKLVSASSSTTVSELEKSGVFNDEIPSAPGAYDTITANILSACVSCTRDSGNRQKFNALNLFAYINAGTATDPVQCYLVENFGKVTGTTKPAINEDDFNSVPLNVGSSREYIQYSLTVKTNSSAGDPTVLYNINALMEQGGYR